MSHHFRGKIARVRLWVLAAAVGLATGAGGGVWFARGGVEMSWPSYADLFEHCAPSVVSVTVSAPQGRVGSGFAVAPDQVITARHLVEDASALSVRDRSGRHHVARLVGSDARSDLALLSIEQPVLVPVRMGSSKSLRIGDTVLAIGNPYGLGQSLSVGVIGNRGGSLAGPRGPRVAFLQLSMALNPGNSGGPVFDRAGLLVGVLVGTHAQGQGIAFAVPVEALKHSLPLLASGARVSRAFLGLKSRQQGSQVVVSSVVPGGPSELAGLRVGDRISAFDGAPVSSPLDLTRLLDGRSGGEQATVRVFRDGALRMIDVTLADWAEQAVVVAGMTLRPASGTGGRVVAVRPGSRAAAAGVREQDVVRAVDGVPVRAPADVKDMLGRRAVQLSLVRGGLPLSVRLGSR